MKRAWNEEIVANLRHSSCIFLRVMRKNTNILSQGKRSMSPEFDPGPQQCERGVLRIGVAIRAFDAHRVFNFSV